MYPTPFASAHQPTAPPPFAYLHTLPNPVTLPLTPPLVLPRPLLADVRTPLYTPLPPPLPAV